ncbi:MAG TPA: histidine kinase [Gaiellaceae bacterium]|nr:histidine kinase [Gaiellaceae bacterium]
MRQTTRRNAFETFLWGEVVLVALLGAALALFLTKASLRVPHEQPQLRLVLTTLYAVGGGLIALLTAIRFTIEGRRFDLMLCSGFSVLSLSWVAFAIGPAIGAGEGTSAGDWASLGGTVVGWAVLACAPFVRGVVERRRAALIELTVTVLLALVAIWLVSSAIGRPAPASLGYGKVSPVESTLLSLLALLDLVAVIGFGYRFRRLGEDLDRWLALGATLTLFASLDYLFGPEVSARDVTQGDFLRLFAYGVLVVGVWRAIQASEFGRAVAEERARVAREIHDGLAQYLFAIATHAAMLESGADAGETIPKLKEAVQAAQTETRFAVLALSSAAGRAPFDAALRRYVDFLTADGALDVELEIDGTMHLAPDEQIEVFRIVQEGLANARKHAHARRAWVTIGHRGADRLVGVRDDGAGFEHPVDGAALGLNNMRQRASVMGGAFSLTTAPGSGTALEVVLRP